MKRLSTSLIIIFACGLFFVPAAQAAVLTIAPSSMSMSSDTIMVSLNTEGESINALEAHLTFNPNEFSIQSVSDGGSIVNLWVERPGFSNASGTVDLSGIIPGGITTASGTVLTMTLVPTGSGASSIRFTVASAQALLNDGQGTPAELSVVSGPFALTPVATNESTPVDTQVPDSFTPEIGQDPDIFGGQYFLVFAATDEQSGINHYEVLEVPSGAKMGVVAGWVTATSPYLLRDQTLSSDIYVRAVDNAGNFRVVRISAPHASVRSLSPWLSELIAGGFAILLIGMLWLIWRRNRHL